MCDSTVFCAATSVVVSVSRLTSDELGLRICVSSITACSRRPRLGDFAVSWTSLSLWIGENVCPARDVKPVLELLDVVHRLLVHVTLHLTECGPSLWYSSRAANLSHSSLSAGLQRRHCENCVIRTGLVRLVLVDDDAFPDGRGELRPSSHVADPPLLNS